MSEYLERKLKEREREVKILQDQNKLLQSQLVAQKEKSKNKKTDQLISELRDRVRELEIDLSFLKKQKGLPDPHSLSRSKISAKTILQNTQQKSSNLYNILLMKSPSNFNSPYLEIDKQKFDNVKLVKQLKNGFEKSCFDTHHFDFIDVDVQKTKQQLDNHYSIDTGNGLLDTNNLIILYGASKTQKKQVLINLLDQLLKQFRQQGEVFHRNPEFQSLNLQFQSSENVNFNKYEVSDIMINISKSNSVQENDKQNKDLELYLQRLKLELLNKNKKYKNTKCYPKVREYTVNIQKQLDNETFNSQCLIYSSSRVLEEAVKEILGLSQNDQGKLISDLFSNQISNPFGLSLILCIQPQVQYYNNTSNTMRLSKICRNLKLELADTNQFSKDADEKFQTILQTQLKDNENQRKNSFYRQNTQKMEIENLKRKHELFKRLNGDMILKNNVLQMQIDQFTFTLEQLFSTVSHQLVLKMQKQQANGNHIKKDASLLVFEKMQKLINDMLFKYNNVRDQVRSNQKSTNKIQEQDVSFNEHSEEEKDDEFQEDYYDNYASEQNQQVSDRKLSII